MKSWAEVPNFGRREANLQFMLNNLLIYPVLLPGLFDFKDFGPDFKIDNSRAKVKNIKPLF